ncbi:MAG: NUDIX domain-containing protein, partial [Kangiellaceae bacterium]|nr:NUDIX domain-containing protein [Kangiellaceae bacterium]
TNHHCDKDSVMLVKRLIKNAVVPEYANHTIGIGGLVVDNDSRVLTIREKAHIKSHPHNWKFPGGMLDPYEHIEEGVKREVLEETGIRTEFVSFVGFRHHHQGQFTTSNIYAICRLKPLNFDIVIQESEIADAKWIDIDQYLADEKIGQFNKAILRSVIEGKGLVSTNLPGYMNNDSDYEVFI